MKNLPETIGSKRNQSVLHLYLRFFYRVISYSGFFSTKLGMSFYRFFYNSFKDYTEGKKWNYICSLIKDGSTVIDVGSNIGSFTKYILQIQKNKDIKIFAAEPELQNIKSFELFFSKEIKEAKINLVKKAITEKNGSFYLHIDPCNPGGHLIAHKGILVEGITIDHLMEKESRNISLIKIDVEGYEPEVISGAIQTIKKHHPNIFIEFNPSFLKEGGTDPILFLNQMIKLNYKIFTFSKNFNIVECSIDEILSKTEKNGWTDILMIHHLSTSA